VSLGSVICTGAKRGSVQMRLHLYRAVALPGINVRPTHLYRVESPPGTNVRFCTGWSYCPGINIPSRGRVKPSHFPPSTNALICTGEQVPGANEKSTQGQIIDSLVVVICLSTFVYCI
jgi:hypothetical protein